MKREIIDIKTGKDYSNRFPVVNREAFMQHYSDDMQLSEMFLPVDSFDEVNVPSTDMHMIGVRSEGVLKKAEYHIGNKKWKKISDSNVSNAFAIGSAGDNAIGWRWKKHEITGPVSNIVIRFSPEKFAQIGLEAFDLDDSLIELKHQFCQVDELVYQLTMAMRNEMLVRNNFCSMYLEQGLQMLCVHLLSHHCTIKPNIKELKGGLSSKKLKLVTEYIEENFNQSVTLDELASLCDISSYHFSRLFRQSLGSSPRQYILKVRVRHAKQLLKRTSLLIEQIGTMVGYHNPNHFSRMFTKQTGHSPLKYRNSH